MQITERLQSSRIVAGRSAIMSPDQQARLVGMA
jgi:hypothetical protein